MATRVFKIRTLHGETDEKAVLRKALANHQAIHLAYRSPEDLAALDKEDEAAIAKAVKDGAEITEAQKGQRRSHAYLNHPQRPPEPEAPACDVIVDLDDGDGGRLTLDIRDWAEAAALVKAGEITVSW